jgi:hypothetical protein
MNEFLASRKRKAVDDKLSSSRRRNKPNTEGHMETCAREKTNAGMSSKDTRWKSRPALVPDGASGAGPTPSVGEARDNQAKVRSALLARDFSSSKAPAGRNTRVRAG